ncbi:hypothetical protein GCM10027176_45690 [Actinoallomurus bryophytorum]|uniref:Uncharacterized protein n=1 Tax=Actinoallomurus bryophytorum TaxID=1490222 RepID=A0A543CCQ8_9ACTN|nr:hypothetical protein [Actinoallomurus bryophytorum]TQL94780.1 hypothetical protein FB559_0262 [Actinoallomurus bryophytorum]
MAPESTNITPPAGGERTARPGETCSCGRLAVIAYVTADHGDVPFCGEHSTDTAPRMTVADINREWEAIRADWDAHTAAGDVIMQRVAALQRTVQAMLAEGEL